MFLGLCIFLLAFNIVFIVDFVHQNNLNHSCLGNFRVTLGKGLYMNDECQIVVDFTDR